MGTNKRICTCGKTSAPPYCDHHAHHHSHEVKAAAAGKMSPIPAKLLLMVMPYWDPLIPPQGIASLKRFLQGYGYNVKAVDVNIERAFKDLYNTYFDILEKNIPVEKRGNFFNVGHDVLQNHIMAHTNYKSEEKYRQLVKLVIDQNYFSGIGERPVSELISVVDMFCKTLEAYLLRLLEMERPSVFGLTVLRGNISASLFAFRLTREKYPSIKTVMGGSVFADNLAVGSPNYENLLKATEGYIDKIMIGQGEKLLLEYLRGNLPESKRVYTLKDNNMEILDFSSLEIPDLSDFDLQHYPYMAATASASCPNECSFCNTAIFSGKYRTKDPQQTLAEAIELYEKYGAQLFFMTDSLLNPIIDDLVREFIKADVSLYFDCYFRVDENCDLSKALYWRQGGLYRTRLGVESGSQHVLDLINKGITVEQTKTTIRSLAYAGVKTTTYWVIGHPGETEEDFQETLSLLDELKNDIWEAECIPFTYHYNGQFHTDRWTDRRKALYPGDAEEMLIAQTWTLDCEPSRKVIFERMCRFVSFCQKIGVPNPYSLDEIYQADKRWQKLHKNAVPPLVELLDKSVYIDENKKIKQVLIAQDTQHYEEFEF